MRRVLLLLAVGSVVALAAPTYVGAQGGPIVTATISITPGSAFPDSTVDAEFTFSTDGAGSFRIGGFIGSTNGAGTLTDPGQVAELTNCSQSIPRAIGCDWNPTGPGSVVLKATINVGPTAKVGGTWDVEAILSPNAIAFAELPIVAQPTTTTTTTTTTAPVDTTSTAPPTTTTTIASSGDNRGGAALAITG